MNAIRIPIDSAVLGGNVVAIDEVSRNEDFAAFERRVIETFHPVYASCKLPIDQLDDIHLLEKNGFELIECQIRSAIDLRLPLEMRRSPYRFERVTTRSELDSVLEIAATTFVHDRFSVDPKIERGISGERYRRYVEQSFASKDEDVYRLFDPASGATVAFKTHRRLPNGEALLLLGGVQPQLQRLGLGVFNTYCELNQLRNLGVRRAITHISAGNYHVFNVEIGKVGFRVLTTYAVLRKVYSAS